MGTMLRIVLLIILTGLGLSAQVKKTEVTRTTTPEADAKGLSPNVPDSESVSTRIERVVVVRLKHHADLLEGLEKQIAEQKIKNAVFLSGVGSAMTTHLHVVSNRSFPSKNTFLDNENASADIISMNGHVINGKIHAHMTLADTDKSFGGHLEKGTRVFTFAIITIGVLPDSVDMSRYDDKNYR